VGFFLYLCTVFQIIRKYAPMMLVVMMSIFAMALAMDEYNDSRRIAEDLRIETCMELETEDYEWDEGQVQPLTDLSLVSPKGRSSLSLGEGWGEVSRAPFISDKQRLGLVRRYALRKALVCYNYAHT